MRIVTVRNVERFAARARPAPAVQGSEVDGIIAEVRRDGDAALRRYEKRFGGRAGTIRVSGEEIRKAYDAVSGEQLDAIRQARDRLSITETALKERLRGFAAVSGGVTVSREFAPIGSVGCYVPGGLARYPSSAVMSITVAKLAGVRRVVAVSPSRDGAMDPMTLAAADLCGADEIYKVGGAHAVAALAYGTRTIRPVDKIVGPGGSFVTAAKAAVSPAVSIDMLAGPTELAVIADDSADPEHVAADIVAQAEHSEDTFCYAITASRDVAVRLQGAVRRRAGAAARGGIVRASLDCNGFIAVCGGMGDAARLADLLAPEHLQVMTKDAEAVARAVGSAGLILLGQTPSPASDYLLGSNHILPTGGQGKTRGPLSVLDFLKIRATVSASTDTLKEIAGAVRVLAESEDLPNHYESVRCRL